MILYGDAHTWEHPKVQNMVWWWCDALFMGPPVLAKYAALSGNDLYLKAMDKWYRQTYDQLYDPQEHLWSRDLDYKISADGAGKTEQNGRKIFWSRGNGWVFGGLAYGVRKGYLKADEYLQAIKKGWQALLKNQQPDGMIGFVQPTGASPSLQVSKELWEVYGTGAFLCAGSEVLRLGIKE